MPVDGLDDNQVPRTRSLTRDPLNPRQVSSSREDLEILRRFISFDFREYHFGGGANSSGHQGVKTSAHETAGERDNLCQIHQVCAAGFGDKSKADGLINLR